MKTIKQLLIIGLLFNISTLFAQQKVALHSNGLTTMFFGISPFMDAYNAASSGDTIYLTGGGFVPPASIDIPLTVFGAGHYPDSTQAVSKTFINGSINLSENADGFHIEGVDINGNLTFANNLSVNNVIVKYCKMITLNITGDNTFLNASTNFICMNSVITGELNLSNAQNTGVFNSIIQGKVNGSFGNIFENNIFIASYGSGIMWSIITGDNNYCNNNIFFSENGRYFAGSSNQIKNNVFVSAAPILGTTPIHSGNYYPVAQNGMLINQTGSVFDYSHNYHLQNPGSFLGIDNTEVGLYGGSYGYKEGAVPSNPHFQLKNISPATDVNGDLNIQIQVEAQDN